MHPRGTWAGILLFFFSLNTLKGLKTQENTQATRLAASMWSGKLALWVVNVKAEKVYLQYFLTIRTRRHGFEAF